MEEAAHIIISVVSISFAFAIMFSGSTEVSPQLATTFVEVFFTVGLGFILHELAHKFVAESYGVRAEYRSWTLGLALAVIIALLNIGFVFAAPGAVQIFADLPRDKIGRIALAGALMNLFLAVCFVALSFLLPEYAGFAKMGVGVNAFLGIFNLIPFGPLDGQKVLAWSPRNWGISIALLIGVLLYSYGMTG